MIGVSMSQLAAANRALIADTLVREGATEYEIATRLSGAAKSLQPLVGELLDHALRLHLLEQVRHDVLDGVLSRSEGEGTEVTACFADLVGFTKLGEQLPVEALPPGNASRLEFRPVLPVPHAQIARRMQGGWLIKVAAVYDEPFWRRDGLSGEAVSVTGPLTVAFDNSPPGAGPGALTGFVGGADAPDYARLPEDERRRVALAGLARLFGPRAERPRAFLERDWAAEEWSLGGPVSSMGTGTMSRFGRALRDPVGPLHWAGTERARRWCGYMDGAVRSGEEAANAVLAGL